MQGDHARLGEVLRLLAQHGQSLASAESLTGGLLAAALTDVPSSSEVFRGGVVAYQVDLKQQLLGVDGDVLADGGAVQERVAAQMAQGARERMEADWGIATTGVAGPTSVDGHPPGTVFIAVAGPGVLRTQRLRLGGDRTAVRRATVAACLDMTEHAVRQSISGLS